MEAWGATPDPEEGVTNSSQEVSSSVISYGRGRAASLLGGLQLRRQAMEEGRQQLGRRTNGKAQVHGVVKDGLS